MRAHRRNLDADVVSHPVSGEESALGDHERTLAEIFADKEQQNTFLNKFLFEQDATQAKEIVDAITDNHVLTDKQDKWMESQRKAFNLRSFEVEQVKEMLQSGDMEHLAELNPNIRLIVGKIGKEKAAEFLGNEFGQLAFADSKAFKKMLKGMQGIHEIDTRRSSLALERDFRDQLFKYGISENDYFDATVDGTTVQTKENLAELANAQYGIFKRAADFISGGALSHRAGKKLFQTFEQQKQLMDETDGYVKSVGKVLALTLNQDTKLALQKYMVEGGELEEKKEKDTINTISDYRSVRDQMDMASVQKRYEQYRDAELKKRNIKNIAQQPHVLDDIKKQFASQEHKQQAQNKARGLFGILFAMMFRTEDDIKTSLK